MIDNQLTTLYGYIVRSDHPPTACAYLRFDDLKPDLAAHPERVSRSRHNELVVAIDHELEKLEHLVTEDHCRSHWLRRHCGQV